MTEYYIDVWKGTAKNKELTKGAKTLTETRIKACKLAKANPGIRVAIYSTDIGLRSPLEDITFEVNTRLITGTVLNGYYLLQWSTPTRNTRTYRVSPKTGKLLDYDKYWKYLS